jgi:hypothetical protein
MASVLDQYTASGLSLDGTRGFSSRTFTFQPAPSPIESAVATALHRDYSAFDNPSRLTARNFNGETVLSTATVSTLDETDPIAPKNTQAGLAGGVVSQIYKSTVGQEYSDKGPVGGKY